MRCGAVLTERSGPAGAMRRQHAGSERQGLSDRDEDEVAGVTGLEPATSGVTGRHSNQLSYTPGARQGAPARPLQVATGSG